MTETIVLLNRATRYEEAQRLASTTLSAALAPEEEAKIRLRLPTVTTDTTTRHIEENRRALQLPHLSDVTQARHRAWLAYNLAMYGQHGQDSAAADEAAAAAASTGDLESSILSAVALACLDCANGYAGRALHRVEELQALTPAGDMTAHHLAAIHLANLLAVVGRLDDAAALVAEPHRKIPEGTRRHGASHLGPDGGGGAAGCGPVVGCPRLRRVAANAGSNGVDLS